MLLERVIERFRIVVLEPINAAPREDGSVAQTQVRSTVHDRNICLAQQSGDCPQRAAEAAVEKHRIFAAKKIRELPFQFAVQVCHPRKRGRAAGTDAVLP